MVIGKQKCFKCKKDTLVVGFGIENYFDVCDENVYDTVNSFIYSNDDIHISPIPETGMPNNFYKYLENFHNVYVSFSNSLNENCLANHCQHCNTLQGNYFLFSETKSPFTVETTAAAKKLTLYQIKLPHDIILPLEIDFGSEDYLIKDYSKFIDMNISLDDLVQLPHGLPTEGISANSKEERIKLMLQYIKEGYDLDKIKDSLGISSSTAENYLLELLSEGKLQYSSFIVPEKEIQILLAINTISNWDKKLKPIKELLDDSISYFDIKVVLAKHHLS